MIHVCDKLEQKTTYKFAYIHIYISTYSLYLWVLGWFALWGSVEDTDAHDKSVLGIKGDIFAIEEDDKDWVKGGAEDERMVPFDVYT